MSAFRVEVDGLALREILVALTGEGFRIRELQATRDKPPIMVGNPIDTLLREFNSALTASAKERP